MPKQHWQDRYREDIVALVVKNGFPVLFEAAWPGATPTVGYYGALDARTRQHFLAPDKRWAGSGETNPELCTVVVGDVTAVEEQHPQFQGSDFIGSTLTSFVMLHPVSCACGKYTDLTWGYEATMSDLAVQLLGR